MTPAQCLCGFTELADETLTDHLQHVFAPQDGVGRDGQIHDETSKSACLCGFSAGTANKLDEHLLAVFTPGDGIAGDGMRHGPQERHDDGR